MALLQVRLIEIDWDCPSSYFGEMALLQVRHLLRAPQISPELPPSVAFADLRRPSLARGRRCMQPSATRMATVTAVTPTTCLRLERAVFHELLGKNVASEILRWEDRRRKRELLQVRRLPRSPQISLLPWPSLTFGRRKRELLQAERPISLLPWPSLTFGRRASCCRPSAPPSASPTCAWAPPSAAACSALSTSRLTPRTASARMRSSA